MFKLFPCDENKIPLVRDWQNVATADLKQLELWRQLFAGRLKYWGIPTGPGNDLLVLDIDVKKDNGFETIKQKGLMIPETMCQKTRSGGAHCLFRYPRDGKHYGNRAGFLPGLDIRGAGGYIIHYGVDQKKIVDPPDWLTQDIAKPVYQPDGPTVKLAPEIAEAIIKHALDQIANAGAGEANNTLNTEAFKVGQVWATGAITREYAMQVLLAASAERKIPSREAIATIASGLDGGGKKPLTSPFAASEPVAHFPIPAPPAAPARWTPTKLSRYDLLNTAKLKKPQLFAEWSNEDISITTADGGTGKTTLKLYEAICLALGQPFLGFDCKQPGKTLFITGEDTDKKLAAMMGQIIRQMGLLEEGIGNEEKVQTILDSIRIKKDADLCLVSKEKSTGFLVPNRDALNKLLEAVEDFQPKMIVLDPISSFWGPESAVNDMNRAVIKIVSELVDKSQACVEMINHMGKASSNSKDMSQFAGRGGTGLPSNARVSRVMRGINEEEYKEMTSEELDERKSAMVCVVNKFSDGSSIYNKPFIIIREGYLFTRKQLSKTKEKEIEHEFNDIARVFTFIKTERNHNHYPSRDLIVAEFTFKSDKISEARVKKALSILMWQGHMGEKIKLIDNPNQLDGGKVFTVVDQEGKEL